MHGIENICCLTGDDVTAGDEPEARRVFDLDGPQLVALTTTMNEGRHLSGRPIVPQPHFLVGAVENPGAPPFQFRVRRAANKAQAGARFLQLQLCYRPELLERFMRAAADAGLSERVAMIPSICILRSVGGIRFVASRVPGIDVPREVVARVENASDAEAECFEIATSSPRTRSPSRAWRAFTSSRSARTPASPSSADVWAFRPRSKGNPMDTVAPLAI